jgi:hypothetical protein
MGDLQNNDIKSSITAFDQLIGDNTTNKSDIASHYNHSPERHRLYVNDSRFLLQYNSTTKFADNPDNWTLKPNAGDTIEYYTAERFRYAVGYVISIGQAFQVNQSLQTGDKVVVGYGDADLANDMASADGWFVEFVPELPDDQGYITVYRDGNQVFKELTRFEKGLTDWRRMQNELNWYNVGNRTILETYTDNGQQFNEIQNNSSIDNDKGPISGNHRVVFGVKAGGSTTGLELEAGSMDVIIKGNAKPILRDKAGALTNNYEGLTAGNWEAIAAVRVNPENDNVNVQLSGLNIMETSTNTDVQLLVISVNPSNTDASSFETPVEHSDQNSALQVTTNVSTFPDVDGNEVTNSTNMGGYQLGYASTYTQDTGTNERRASSGRVRKRNIYNGDVAVVLAKAGDPTEITFENNTEQEW